MNASKPSEDPSDRGGNCWYCGFVEVVGLLVPNARQNLCCAVLHCTA